ncbi:MAG: chorismate mutase [Candidatus Gracilibacteria bacterium]|jgi:chorismate mutase
MDKIHILRAQIDKIDEKINKLLEKRKEKSLKIGQIKIKTNVKITDKTREKAILDKLVDSYSKNIFKKIISESKKLQKSHQKKLT